MSQEHKTIILCDLCDVPEPETVEARIHTGVHPHLMKTMLAEKHFDAAYRTCYKGFCEAVRRGHRRVLILCVDKQGRWGALTFARVMIEIAISDRELQFSQITTLTAPPDLHCGPCDACRLFDRRWLDKNVSLKRAIARWKHMAKTGVLP